MIDILMPIVGESFRLGGKLSRDRGGIDSSHKKKYKINE